MVEIVQTQDDPRPIVALYFNDADGGVYFVGREGITKIIAYSENGMHAYLAAFAVFKGEHLHVRVPAWKVEVMYLDPKDIAARMEAGR